MNFQMQTLVDDHRNKVVHFVITLEPGDEFDEREIKAQLKKDVRSFESTTSGGHRSYYSEDHPLAAIVLIGF